MHEFVAEKGRDERLILRKCRGRGEKVRFDLVGILEVAQAHRIAMRPVIYQARGPASERFRAVLHVAKLGDLRPVAEDGVDAGVRRSRKPGRPARIQSVERPSDRQRVALAVAEPGVRVVDRGPTVESVGQRDPVHGCAAIGIGGACGTDENAGAEGVGVPQREPGLVDAPSAARAPSGLELSPLAHLARVADLLS